MKLTASIETADLMRARRDVSEGNERIRWYESSGEYGVTAGIKAASLMRPRRCVSEGNERMRV